eukprot:snap_masked-scaffold_23-processed-gene-1.17-mRNA-1 protein AED:1.00 eAED:1.00 QI:0/0/0/0/1/1/3/0/86
MYLPSSFRLSFSIDVLLISRPFRTESHQDMNLDLNSKVILHYSTSAAYAASKLHDLSRTPQFYPFIPQLNYDLARETQYKIRLGNF